MSRIQGVALAAVLTIVVSTVATAAVGERSPARFDDRVRHREGGRIGVEAKALDELDAADPLRVGWEGFVAAHGGRWRVFVDERSGLPTLVSGRGVDGFESATGEIDMQEMEKRARAFIDGSRGLLGTWDAGSFELDLEASGKLRGDHWQLVFRQVVDGVRVENARLDLQVKQGRLVMFGASHWGRVTTRGIPTVDALGAREELDKYLATPAPALESVEAPQLVLIALDPDPADGEPQAWAGERGKGLTHALIWRFRLQVPGEAPLWIAEVDAHGGGVRAFYDGTHYASIEGGVFPISNDGDCADGGCEVAGFPMPFADYAAGGEPDEFADPFGNLTCGDPVVTIETNLAGPYIRIEDACGPLNEAGICQDGVDLGLKNGENCSAEPGASPGNSAAARTSYYHLNRVAEAARFYNPANSWLNSEVEVRVNQSGTCNAFWNNGITMLQAGNGCGNTGEQHGVLVHEWGHGYDFNDGGGEDVPSEAYADVVTIFASRASCISRGWYNDGRTCTGYGDTCLTCTGVRDHDWAARERNTPATPGNFTQVCPSGPGGPCGREAHCESYPISETIFDLATRDLPAAGMDPDSAWQLAERLWYVTRPGAGGEIYNCFRTNLAHSCFATHWMQRMLVVDDDDGDLSNGTPHAAAIYAAFDRHDIACGSADDPENLSTSSCPAISAPTLFVVEIPSGTELSWAPVAGADEIRVYRNELGCNRQQVPIAALAGGETLFVDGVADADLPRYYRVEAIGANAACSSPVSNCEAIPLSARLQQLSYRVVKADPDPSGFPNPGETIELPVTLFNSGLDGSFGVTGQLSLVDPAQGVVTRPNASWADIASSDTGESLDPQFELTVAESVMCGDTLRLETEVGAANAVPTRRRIDIQLGDQARDFLNDVAVPIPPETTEPVSSSIAIDQDQIITELDVSVEISHDFATELIVELTSPEGTTVRLHDQSNGTSAFALRVRYDLERAPDGPGSMQDFVGETTLGSWTLSVQDVGSGSTSSSSITSWTLHFEVAGGFDCVQAPCSEPSPTEPVEGLRVELSPGGADLDFSWSPVTVSAGYRLWWSSDPTFGAGGTPGGTTAGETAYTMVGGTAATPDLTYFQVRAVNGCGEEGP